MGHAPGGANLSIVIPEAERSEAVESITTVRDYEFRLADKSPRAGMTRQFYSALSQPKWIG